MNETRNPKTDQSPWSLVASAVQIIRAHGRVRFLGTLALIVSQAIAQVVGVASIFWFISVAVSPEAIRENSVVRWGLNALEADAISTNSLTLACGVCSLCLLVTSNLLSLCGEYARALYAHGLGCWLRDVLLRRIMSRPYQHFLHANSSVLVKKVVQDVMQFVQQIVLPSLEIATRVLILVMLTCWLIMHEPVVAIGGMALFALFELSFISVIRSRAAAISAGVKTASRESYSAVGQIFSGMKPIITENSREHFAQTHQKPSTELARLVPQTTLVGSIAKYALETVVYGGLVTWMLLELLSGNTIQQLMPSVGLFSVAAYRMLPCVQIIASQVTTIQSTKYSLQEILEEFEQPLDCSRLTFEACSSVNPMQIQSSLEIKNVCFSYKGAEQPALPNLTLSIQQGDHIGIVGATGSGKSTLVDLVLGLHSPDSGSIQVDGHRLHESNIAGWRAAIGYVPQDPFLIDATIAENIAFGVRPDHIDRDHAMAVAKIAQISDFIQDECQDGLDTVVGERGARISGGQKQRLAIARALYKRPQLLILDEATSALDNVTEKQIARGLAGLGRTLTIISIAHRLSTIEECDCIYHLENGRLTSSGSYPELISRSAEFRELVNAG